MTYSGLRATRDPALIFGADKLPACVGIVAALLFGLVEALALPEAVRSAARNSIIMTLLVGCAVTLASQISDWWFARTIGRLNRPLVVPLAEGVTYVGRPAEVSRLAADLRKPPLPTTRHTAFFTRGRWLTALLCPVLIPPGLRLFDVSVTTTLSMLLGAYFALMLTSVIGHAVYDFDGHSLRLRQRAGLSTVLVCSVDLRSSLIRCDLEEGTVCVQMGADWISVDLGALVRPHRFVVELLRIRLSEDERQSAAAALRRQLQHVADQYVQP